MSPSRLFGVNQRCNTRNAWLATGNKIRPSDVEQYVMMLAQHIDDHERREAFVNEARRCIRL